LTPSVWIRSGSLPPGSSSGSFPTTYVLSMPGTDRTIVSDATFSQSSRTSSAGAVSRTDSRRTHVRVARSTVTVSTMSSRDSRRSPPTERDGAFGLFLGSSRARAASSPSSSSEPEPEPEPDSESESSSEKSFASGC